MIIYLYGPDSYRRQEKLKEIVEKFEAKHSTLTIDHFRLSQEGEFDRLRRFVESQSLFEKAKLAVVHEAEESGKEAAEFLKSVLESKTVTVVVSAEEKLPKEFNFLEKKAFATHEFEKLTGSELLTFLKKEAEKRKLKISGETIQVLMGLYPGDTWGLVTELEKMTLGGEVREGVSRPPFFPLVQTIKAGLLPRRLSALAYALEYEEPAAVFNVVASLSGPELKIKMADYDVAIKSGKLEYPEALLDLVLSTS
jgi:hypothetical protein